MIGGRQTATRFDTVRLATFCAAIQVARYQLRRENWKEMRMPKLGYSSFPFKIWR